MPGIFFWYYSAELGRWLSRDPIGERGGVNLYGMVGNDPVNRWDYLGQSVGVTLPKQALQVGDARFPNLVKGLKQVYISDINKFISSATLNSCEDGPLSYSGPSRRFSVAPSEAQGARIPDEPYVDPVTGSTNFQISDSYFGDETQNWLEQRTGLGQFVIDIQTPVAITKDCTGRYCEYSWSAKMYLEDNAGERLLGIPERRVKLSTWSISGKVSCCH